MGNRLNSPTKATIWFTLGNFIAKGIAFVSLPIFTRLMDASEYGIASLLLTYEQIILIFGTFEMYLGTYQRGIFKYKEKSDAYSGITILLMNSITVVVFLLLLINNKLLFQYTKITMAVLIGMFARTLFQPAYECWLVRKRIAYDYKNATISNVVLATLNVIIPILVMSCISPTAEIRITSALLATSVFALCFWIVEIKKLAKQIRAIFMIT